MKINIQKRKVYEYQAENRRLKQQIRLRETADDGYYLSRQYKEDARALYELERQLPPAGTPRQPPRT